MPARRTSSRRTHGGSARQPSASAAGEIDVVRRRALGLVLEMMAIPGKSREERRIIEFIARKLRQAGVPSSCLRIDAVSRKSPGDVGNLIVKLPGARRLARRLLMAHVDTVPICVGCRPVIDGEYVRSADPTTGLGGDNRAGAAVVLNSYLELRRRKIPHPPLTLFFPVQEEIGLNGARYVSLNQLGKPAYGFNWDGSEADMACIGATGDYGIEIVIEGIASHAGVHPEEGVSAIAVAALAIAELTREGWHGLIVKDAGRGTSNVGVIHGGEATNVVTPRVHLRAEVRSHDPQFRKIIVEQYRQAFAAAAQKVKSSDGRMGSVRFEADLKYESFRIDPAEPVVSLATSAMNRIGLTAQTCISNGGLDANWMTAHGLPTVTLGCGQHDIHTVRESLHIPSFLDACRIGLVLASGDVG